MRARFERVRPDDEHQRQIVADQDVADRHMAGLHFKRHQQSGQSIESLRGAAGDEAISTKQAQPGEIAALRSQ
jgi:hypothetical protein